MNNIYYMQQALIYAEKASESDEVPIGAVMVHNGKMIAGYGNRTRELKDPTAHAEILCIRQACQEMGAQRIPECELYVTLEPCAMCAAAIGFARIHKLLIGASDPKGGAVLHGPRLFEQPTCHHRKIELIQGIEEQRCADILQAFFRQKRV